MINEDGSLFEPDTQLKAVSNKLKLAHWTAKIPWSPTLHLSLDGKAFRQQTLLLLCIFSSVDAVFLPKEMQFMVISALYFYSPTLLSSNKQLVNRTM